ncbi:hypothetical protein P4S72_15570 [Vibrio sp. PP-XX7]
MSQDNPQAYDVPEDGYLGWNQVRPESQIRLIPVSGEHTFLLSAPYVQDVGRAISDAILHRVHTGANQK